MIVQPSVKAEVDGLDRRRSTRTGGSCQPCLAVDIKLERIRSIYVPKSRMEWALLWILCQWSSIMMVVVWYRGYNFIDLLQNPDRHLSWKSSGSFITIPTPAAAGSHDTPRLPHCTALHCTAPTYAISPFNYSVPLT